MIAARNRLDHVLPQGYLAGFVNESDGQLRVFDCAQKRWFASGTAGVGAIRGFYDYSEGSGTDETADQAFRELENEFPAVRRELVASRFSGWRKHLDLLLRFAQMLRTRSELFREQELARGGESTFYKVEEVVNATTLKVRPYVPESREQHEAMLRNMSITQMRTEIARGTSWMSQLHWCLRLTSISNPVITADHPVVVQGKSQQLTEDAMRHPDTLLFFPICSEACLFGSPCKFDKKRDVFSQSDLEMVRGIYLKTARRFVFSPVELTFAE